MPPSRTPMPLTLTGSSVSSVTIGTSDPVVRRRHRQRRAPGRPARRARRWPPARPATAAWSPAAGRGGRRQLAAPSAAAGRDARCAAGSAQRASERQRRQAQHAAQPAVPQTLPGDPAGQRDRADRPRATQARASSTSRPLSRSTNTLSEAPASCRPEPAVEVPGPDHVAAHRGRQHQVEVHADEVEAGEAGRSGRWKPSGRASSCQRRR